MDSPTGQGYSDPFKGAAAAEFAARPGASGGAAPKDPTTTEPTSTAAGPAAVDRVWDDLRALRAAVELFVAVRRDQVKLSLRRAFFYGIAIGLAILVVAILAATACVMLVIGIAGGMGELLGGRIWLGQLLTGCGLVVGGGCVGFLLFRIAQQRSRRKTLERYGKVQR